MKYKVVLRKSEGGFSASCPGLPGCWSEGETEEEALHNITEAISEYLSAKCEVDPGLVSALEFGEQEASIGEGEELGAVFGQIEARLAQG